MITVQVLVFALLAGSASAGRQERLFELMGSATGYYSMAPFLDYDRDGSRDFVVGVAVNPSNFATMYGALRVISGRDGTILLQNLNPRSVVVRDAGDIDLDGIPDFIGNGPGRPNPPQISVWAFSLVTDQVFWTVYGPAYNQFAILGPDLTLMAGHVDLNCDGRPDFVVATYDPNVADVSAYDNSGALLYHVPVRQLGFVPRNVTAMPDLDGDGCDEFLIGALDGSGRGAVVVVSGRAGSILRVSHGLQVGDYIGGAVCNAGDVDGDGVADYAAASFWFSPLLSIVTFSGRTGAPIRNVTDYWTTSGGLLGNIDVDLDGVPDLLVANGGWNVSLNVFGQIRAYSGRDGSVLWNIDATSQIHPIELHNLGVQAGSPYPTFGFLDTSWVETNSLGSVISENRIAVYRTNLPGAGPVSGTPCSRGGYLPQIGIRHVPGHIRITASGGPPGALAWLAGGPAAQTVYNGVPLPYSLDSFGLFGCSAYVPPVVVVPTILGTTGLDRGYAAVDLPWPLLSPSGHAYAAQWLMLDPATGNYALTARHEFKVR